MSSMAAGWTQGRFEQGTSWPPPRALSVHVTRVGGALSSLGAKLGRDRNRENLGHDELVKS